MTIMTSDSATKIRAATLVLVTVIVAVGLIIAAVIISNGYYDRCMESDGTVMTVAASKPLKAMVESRTMDVTLQMGGQTAMQRMRYDHGANVVIVDAPANISGSTAATIVVDYDRSLIFISVDDEEVCVGSTLDDQMSTAIVDFMENNEEAVIDVATNVLHSTNYVRKEVIAPGYVAVSNGPIIGQLCSEGVSYWTVKADSMGVAGREKRQIGSISITFCIFGNCFTFTFGF